jgi:16S rRNA (cytosine967-C5)-methyltransferase
LVTSKKTRKLPARLVLVLGLGIYELCYLDKVPDYATVHWYVESVKRDLSLRFARLANAVLREASRQKEALQSKEFFQEDAPSEALFLSRYFSCPQWIVALWLASYGYSACTTLLQQSIRPPCLGIRINLARSGATELQRDIGSWPETMMSLGLDHLFVLSKTPQHNLVALEDQGCMSRQSPGSFQTLVQSEPLSWPVPVWDACAGHGGKTGALLEMGCPSVWASDISWSKACACSQELQRLELSGIPVFVSDMCKDSCSFHKPPGTVLLDVPCSGLGVLSRRPDIKWKRDLADTTRLQTVQSQMLRQAFARVAAPGKLIYMTCTLNPAENEEQIEKLMQEHPRRLSLEDQWQSPFETTINEFFYVAVLNVSS